MVKAGKSTLLNAMLGEQIAPTDAGECTRVVTWYRYSDDAHHHAAPARRRTATDAGPPRAGPARDRPRRAARPRTSSGSTSAGRSTGLKSMILIDTPGIASLSEDTSERTTRFLTPEESPSVRGCRRLPHAAPARVRREFLEAFRDTAAGAAQTVCAVGVLSRSDEIGSGRIDSLLSAGKVARRYERDGDLARSCSTSSPSRVSSRRVPARSASTSTSAFRELAGLDRADRERLLVSADRFTRESDVTTLSCGRSGATCSRDSACSACGWRLRSIRGGVDSLVRAVGRDGAAERAGRAAAVRA